MTTNGRAAASARPSENTGYGRDTFSTGQIGRMLRVAPRTVSKWFDAGRLRGYRIPGSTDRRVPRDDLLRFLAASNLPVPPELAPPPAPGVLVLADPGHPAVGLAEAAGARAAVAANGFEAGVAAAEAHDAFVLDAAAVGRAACLNVARGVRLCYPDAPVLILACEDEADEAGLRELGSVLRAPCPPASLKAAVGALLARAQKEIEP